MKRIRITAYCLAFLMLCCACSAAAVQDAAPASDTGTSPAEPPAYTDVPADAWYAEAAKWGLENGIFDPGTFAPDVTMYRPMVAEAIYRAAGSPAVEGGVTYPDIPEGRYTAPAAWAAEQGLMSGYANGFFGLNDPVTREQMAAILWRYAGSPAAEAGEDFADEANIASFSKTAVDWARANGVINGKEGNRFDPKGLLTRAQAAAILYRYLTASENAAPPSEGGSRSSTAMHYQVAEDHGFTAIADVVILDENGSMTLPVTGGTVLTENYVGAHFADYDSYLVLSHFKGHAMAGFGGAIKNISIGIGSSEGKCWIHSGGTSHTSPWGGDQTAFTESMAEAGKSAVDALDGNIVYVNVMNRLSVDCDCDGNPAEPDLHDIGILASTDPVALDQACVDLIYAQRDGDGASLVNRIESRNGSHTLEHGEEIGLGSQTYKVVNLDS